MTCKSCQILQILSNDLPDKLAALEFSGSTLNFIARGLFPHPRQQLRNAVLERHLRLVTKQLFRLRNVSHAMPYIALTILADNLRIQIDAQTISEQATHLANRRRSARADIHRLVIRAICLEG